MSLYKPILFVEAREADTLPVNQPGIGTRAVAYAYMMIGYQGPTTRGGVDLLALIRTMRAQKLWGGLIDDSPTEKINLGLWQKPAVAMWDEESTGKLLARALVGERRYPAGLTAEFWRRHNYGPDHVLSQQAKKITVAADNGDATKILQLAGMDVRRKINEALLHFQRDSQLTQYTLKCVLYGLGWR